MEKYKQLRLTEKEMKLFLDLIKVKVGDYKIKQEIRTNEECILLLVKENNHEEFVWKSLKSKLIDEGIIFKRSKKGQCGEIFTINYGKFFHYYDNVENLITITLFGDDLSVRVKEIISKYRDKYQHILNLEKVMSDISKKQRELKKREKELQDDFKRVEKKFNSIPDREKIKSFSKVIDSIDQLPEEDLLQFFKEILEK